jgi:excisionase family DNA binding protein
MSDTIESGRKCKVVARQFKLFENRIVLANGKPSSDAAFLRADELAALLGVGVTTVRRWARFGKLKSVRPGKDWLFATKEIESFLLRKKLEILKHDAKSF